MNSSKITITAHAGAMKTPDNSEESIIAALKIKADIIELDVNFLENLTPVLSHNTPLKSKEYVTLSRAFEMISPYENVLINLDMKHTYNLKRVEEEAQKYSLENRIFFTGIEEKDVSSVKEQCRFTDFYLNFEPSKRADDAQYDALCKKLKEIGAVGLNTNFKVLTKKCVDILHRNGFLVSAWTVDDSFNMKRLINMGVDNITTRRPDRLFKILDRR